ncbi:MAG: sensor histidine kinase [Bacteroidales bacterium]
MNYKKILEHTLIWIALLLLRVLSGISSQSILESFSISTLLYAVYAITFYATAYVQARYFENKKLFVLLGSLFLILFAGTFMLRASFRTLEYLTGYILPVGVAEYGFIRIVFVILCGDLYQVFNNKKRAEQKAQKILLEKTENELHFLKNQMNPHFFFNTLNNIYGLAYKQDKRAPEVILMLSESMRYIIYETQSHYVPLSKEISFLKNYIELEQLRLINNKNVHFNLDIPNSTLKIAPLILLPFIENCFKHSNIDENTEAHININIWLESDNLNFSCENTFTPKTQKKPGGVGTANVKKRLNLIYKENYELENNIKNNTYFVFLKLPLKR